MVTVADHLSYWVVFWALVAGSAHVSGETLYHRWVDENGVVYYSDRVPPQATGRAREKVNKRGVVVDAVAAAKTPDERKAGARLNALRAEQQRLLVEQASRDEVLLRTFGTEAELLQARDNRLAAIDIMIEITSGNSNQLKDHLLSLQKDAAELELNGKPVPHKLVEEIKRTRQQITHQEAEIAERQRDKERLGKKFQRDLERFQELQTLERLSSSRPADPGPQRKPLLSVFECPAQESCNKAWTLAQLYVQEHATTRFHLISDAIIMTAKPTRDEDFGILVSRIPGDGSSAQLFLDVQCKDSSAGQNLCKSDTVKEIKRGFQPYIASRLR